MSEKYPLFRKENMVAYLSVISIYVLIALISSISLFLLVEEFSFGIILIWNLIAVMLGMNIMFISSVINLKKLRPGFKRLAKGEDPNIPNVWCPVLTMATRASMELAQNKKKGNIK